jgi:hypothetical protein
MAEKDWEINVENKGIIPDEKVAEREGGPDC